eukprot:TRINITY_DN7384_c0_g1_i1.p1 TRINITY_DN7384_c0_g1~~TRINITY_DN7384_c0_g1_i1.p1  ORF type:complete len:277 (-),score=55.75 TRINITY_DN7384_c0_g1_i1:116-946(-)
MFNLSSNIIQYLVSKYDTVLFYSTVVATITAVVLPLFPAPYGRLNKLKGFGVSPVIGWMVMESPTVWLAPILYVLGKPELTTGNIYNTFLLILFEIHYVWRTIIQPLTMPSSAKSSLMHVSTIASAFVFQIQNVFLIFFYLFFMADTKFYNASMFYDPRFFVGFAMYVWGSYINRQSDGILRNIKKNSTASPSAPPEKRYSIPRGAMFEYVSAPNYFGETVEWFGFGIMMWSAGGILFGYWTLSNLLPRAISSHNWYKRTFRNYPKDRKAMIPFLI